MRIVYFSDTHNHHRDLDLPEGDLLIFGGDCCHNGSEEEFLDFMRWFQRTPHLYKIFVAGNHDMCLDPKKGNISSNVQKELNRFTNLDYFHFYLNNSKATIEGITFWGSPFVPSYGDWAFGLTRGTEMELNWEKIPNKIDVLITHVPPMYHNDLFNKKDHIGCSNLTYRTKKVKPKIHLSGHVHESYGISYSEDTLFLNGSIESDNGFLNKPFVFDIKGDKINLFQ